MEVSSPIPVNNEAFYRYKGEREIEWESKGRTVIRMTWNKDNRDLTLYCNETFLPNIRKVMQENNEAGLSISTLDEKLEDKTGLLIFRIQPNNNPNLQWRDWLTQINHLIKSRE